MRAVLIAVLLFLPLQWNAAAESPTYVMCKFHKQVRTIRVIPDSEDREGCLTAYTREGRDRVIGSGRWAETCFGFLDRVRKNLEEADWKCRDISHAGVTISDASRIE